MNIFTCFSVSRKKRHTILCWQAQLGTKLDLRRKIWGRWENHCQTSEPAGPLGNRVSSAVTCLHLCIPFDNCLPFKTDWISAIDLLPQDLTRFRHENEIWLEGKATSCLEQVRGWICSVLVYKVTNFAIYQRAGLILWAKNRAEKQIFLLQFRCKIFSMFPGTFLKSLRFSPYHRRTGVFLVSNTDGYKFCLFIGKPGT